MPSDEHTCNGCEEARRESKPKHARAIEERQIHTVTDNSFLANLSGAISKLEFKTAPDVVGLTRLCDIVVNEASFDDVLDPVCIGFPTVSGSGTPWTDSSGFTRSFQTSIVHIGIDIIDVLTCLDETVLLDVESLADSW